MNTLWPTWFVLLACVPLTMLAVFAGKAIITLRQLHEDIAADLEQLRRPHYGTGMATYPRQIGS